MYPVIKKAKLIPGTNILLRDATVEDSEFILSLRLDPQKSKYISRTSDSLEDQIKWFRNYEISNDQAYFIISNKNMEKLGCIRIYDPIELTYCWGSWLMVDGLSPLVSLESALLIYLYGKYLGFKHARIDVRKDNLHVCRFHERFFCAEKICETEEEYCYLVSEDKINASLKKFKQLITKSLIVNNGC